MQMSPTQPAIAVLNSALSQCWQIEPIINLVTAPIKTTSKRWLT